MNLIVGSDERTKLTDSVVEELSKRGHTLALVGPLRGETMLWPDVAQHVAECVARGEADEGIVFCWTGTGVAMAANKVPGIRAALCHDAETAKGARLWNRANVLCLSLRATSEVIAKEILDAWFGTPLGTDAVDVECVERVGRIEDKYAGRQVHR
ncbi:MAG: RpiB/LacA/LacB family sugar-phosphate isomerase [Chloroflexi bacterium]|nr:RpiB/LacA/LacB family sugar-phosphate isomerase [Chloroflexota bacterium]